MKTKLLLLFLVFVTFAKSQISIQESFEGGTTPTNWTNNGFGYFNNSGFATTGNYSTFASITIGSDRTLTTNSQISTGLAIDVSVQVRKNIGPAGFLGLYYLVGSGTTLNPIVIENFGTQYIAYHKLSGTIPAGTIPSGTSVKFVIRAAGTAGTGGEAYFDDFSAAEVSATVVPPTISAIATTSFQNSVNFNYSLNANNGATTSVIRYGISSGALVSQITGFSANGNTVKSDVITLSGLLPSKQYFFQIDATNSAGSTSSTIESFTTTAAPPTGQLITEYNFNNTYNNINGNTPFGSNTGTSFVTGRDGVTANGALNINNTGSIATITGLPYGNSARTVSLWVKTNNMNSSYNMIFSYGQGSSSNAIGASYNANNCEMFGYANNLSIPSTNTNNTWYHFVYTYDGTNAKIYKNGVLLTTQTKNWNTINSSNAFKLGRGVGNEFEFNGAIDDLKIYNYAVTDADVSNLYNYNSLLGSASIFSINSTSITTNSASINYSLNANNFSTTSIVKYGLTSGNLTNSATGFTATGNTITPGTVSLTGLLPNTQYFYTVEATNVAGTISSAENSFTTLANPMSTIAEYNFDNTYNNILGSRPFTANTGTSFTQDRNGNANSALNLVSIGTTATIPNLPYNSDSRTISVWVKNYTYNSFVASACPFSYGTNSNTYEFYMAQSGISMNPYSPYSNQHIVDLTALGLTNALNVWNHYAVSYNGTTSKIYKDGVLLSTLNIAITPTTNNSDIFKLGLLNSLNSGYFDGAIDDLKIYNYALSDAEVISLYTNNAVLATTENSVKNTEMSIYPNPAKDFVNIQSENKVKSVEIFTMEGRLVLTAKAAKINTSGLKSGVYLMKITDAKNNVTTKKLIIK